MAQEKQFEKRVERYLESVGVYQNTTKKQDKKLTERGWFFKVWGGGFQSAGIPDLVANINGIFITIELKASNGRPSEIQKRNTKLINQTNGIGVILYPQGFDEFKKIIEGVLKCDSHIQELAHLRETHLSSDLGILRD